MMIVHAENYEHKVSCWKGGVPPNGTYLRWATEGTVPTGCWKVVGSQIVIGQKCPVIHVWVKRTEPFNVKVEV